MASEARDFSLADGLNASGLSVEELWWIYLSVGGYAGRLELEAYTLGLLRPDWLQHDLIAQAINEHFMSLGGDHPVAYFTDE